MTPSHRRREIAAIRPQEEQIVRTSPNAFLIVVCNPLDVMVYAAAAVSRFEHRRVMGMAGVLDSARFAAFIAEHLGVSVGQVSGILLGGHGDDMVPLPRYTTVGGAALTELMDGQTIQTLSSGTQVVKELERLLIAA